VNTHMRRSPAADADKWLVCPRRNPAARVSLVCFASAGHGPSMFRSWSPLLPAEIELSIAQLPGREARWNEKAAMNVADVLPGLLGAVGSLPARPLVLFGHSLGAMIAFELARALRSATGAEPHHLFVSAHRAAQLPNRHSRISDLDDAEFVAAVNGRHGGVPPDVAANKELMDLMLPSLKADYRIFEDYRFAATPPLACPVTAFGGTADEYISQSELESWREQTSGAFSLRMFDGGHFFVNDLRPRVVATIVQGLAVPV